MHNLGCTRSSYTRDHLLQTPDTFVRTSMPGLQDGKAIVHIGPAAGAAFTQYTVEIESSGRFDSAGHQRFIFVTKGVADLSIGERHDTLKQNSFAFLPQGVAHRVTTRQQTVMAVIEKPYEPLAGAIAPDVLVGSEEDVRSDALMGDDDLQVRCLLPDHAGFDFAVNTMTYKPGAALAGVESHYMEHGLLMLEGGGIYRLGEDWYSVAAGDFIWMGPFCPQWFAAVGKRPAKYLIYKDANRHPMA